MHDALPSVPDRLPRCCPAHHDWTTLARHLVAGFPDADRGDIVRELTGARRAVEAAGLPHDEGLATAEAIARHQLLLLTGRANGSARLDPERHAGRIPDAAC